MADIVKFLVIGLGSGGAYALLAIGIVLVHKTSGVINFANGAMALFGAAVFYEVRPLAGVTVAVAAAVIAGAVLGLAVQWGVMRPLRSASSLTRLVATLGVMALLDSVAELVYGSDTIFVPPFLTTRAIRIGEVVIGADRLAILVIAAVLTIALAALYSRTRFGLATTAVAENELATAALGWSPAAVAAVNWSAAGGLAALAGVLLVPITGLSPTGLTLAIVAALAAALIGRFSSFGPTFAGGLLIGVLQSETTRFVPAPGWAEAVPFLVIVVLLVVRGQALPQRSHLSERLPRLGSGVPSPTLTFVLVAAGTGIAAVGAGWADAVTGTAVTALMCLSLVVLVGYCGQLSLAQWALAGIAALVAGRLADSAQWPFPLAAAAGVVAAVPVGLLVALPAVRARGASLAVATLGLATVITSVVLANPLFTGDPARGTVLPPPTLLGWSVSGVDHPTRYALMTLAVLLLAMAAVANLRRATLGRRMVAVRDNERAAASVGIGVPRTKLAAFAVGAVFAALAGVLSIFQNTHVDYSTFQVFGSINVLLYTVIGGAGYVSGSVAGGVNAQGGLGEEVLSQFFSVSDWYVVLTSAVVLLVILTNANGIADELTRLRRKAVTGFSRAGPDTDPLPKGTGSTSWDAATTSDKRPLALEIREVTVRFGGVVAIDALSFSVHPGEVVGLIGPNGAGKSTVVDVATGFVQATSGSVLLGGNPIDRLSPDRRARSGLTRSFQSLELFEDLTVADNLRTASDPRGARHSVLGLLRPQNTELGPAGSAALAEFGLTDVLDRRPAELPYAQRRLVGIARAVAMAPSVLLLDEPAAGLDGPSTRELTALIRRLASNWGMGVLLIEHDVSMVLSACDRVVVLDHGLLLSTGTPQQIRDDTRVVAAYLGTQTP